MANKRIVKKAKAWLGRSTLGKKLTALIGKEATPKKWVFIIGCYNSGTTLLSTILAKHPEIASLPTEGAFLTDAMQTPEQHGWVRMWSQCLSVIEQTESTPEIVAKRIKRSWGFWYDSSKPIYLEKSISNAARIKFLARYYQPAYFIYIVRNGYSVAEGIKRKSTVSPLNTIIKESTYPIELCAKQWVSSDDYIIQNKDKLANFLMIQYEELVEKPAMEIDRICQFLQIDSEPLKAITQEKLSVTGYNSTIQNMNEASIKRLSQDDIAIINSIAGDKLENYGYQVL